jgi:hypothetical protein
MIINKNQVFLPFNDESVVTISRKSFLDYRLSVIFKAELSAQEKHQARRNFIAILMYRYPSEPKKKLVFIF